MISDAQHFALSNPKETRPCSQQREDVQKQLDLASGKVTNVEAASAEATV